MHETLTIPTGDDTAPRRAGLLTPVADAAELAAAHREAAELVANLLEEGKDYGVIPGTGDKPTLLKPGAERLCLAFGLSPTYQLLDAEVDHDREVEWAKRRKRWLNRYPGDREFVWDEETGCSVGLYRYAVRCTLLQRGTGEVVAEGLATASSLESKWVERPRESENTILKIAQKRALVAATLNACGLSDRFTQDLEDGGAEAARQRPANRAGAVKQNGRAARSGGPGELIGELVRGYREAADAEAFAAVEEHFQAAALNETQRRPVETARAQARERLALPDEAAA